MKHRSSVLNFSILRCLFQSIVYAIISIVSVLLIVLRSYSVTAFGLKTTQIFFKQILNSILHAPMSFYDTTPSGRILSRASTDQTNVDIFIPLFVNFVVAMYIKVASIIIVTCQNLWPTTSCLVEPLVSGLFSFYFSQVN
ncbi:unnamed protein product [Lathyrus sativus]|nr:unnamed protein product [Lathyrus sativus]